MMIVISLYGNEDDVIISKKENDKEKKFSENYIDPKRQVQKQVVTIDGKIITI